MFDVFLGKTLCEFSFIKSFERIWVFKIIREYMECASKHMFALRSAEFFESEYIIFSTEVWLIALFFREFP